MIFKKKYTKIKSRSGIELSLSPAPVAKVYGEYQDISFEPKIENSVEGILKLAKRLAEIIVENCEEKVTVDELLENLSRQDLFDFAGFVVKGELREDEKKI